MSSDNDPQQSQGHGDKHENASGQQNITIIKKVKKKMYHKGHGGSWKVAYADFVTAMMTFFLLMWLLSMLNKSQLEGISKYFKDPNRGYTEETPKNEAKLAPSGDEVIKSIQKEKKNRQESEQMKKDLVKQLKENPKVSQYENILNFVVTAEGLKIELKELENKAMFSTGKADFADYAQDILDWLGPALNKYPSRVMIIGHTDGAQYNGVPNYSNWELSTDRANATRRALIDHGMLPEKIVRISGMADTDKLETAVDNMDPKNRRIVIIILNDDAYKKIMDQ